MDHDRQQDQDDGEPQHRLDPDLAGFMADFTLCRRPALWKHIRHGQASPECSSAALRWGSASGRSGLPLNRQRKTPIQMPPMPAVAERIKGRSPQGIRDDCVGNEAGTTSQVTSIKCMAMTSKAIRSSNLGWRLCGRNRRESKGTATCHMINAQIIPG